MQIKKSYHFHAAHRNQELEDKCCNIHGHSYHVDLYFEVERATPESAITTLFSDIDATVQPLLEKLDHGFLVDVSDPVYQYLLKGIETGVIPRLKFHVLDEPTSVENMAFEFFQALRAIELRQVDLKETTTSTIIYTRADFERDLELKGFVAEGRR